MGAFGLMKMGELFGTPLDQWPPEVWEVLHLVLEKKVGDNLNEDTRPIKLLSALLRAFTIFRVNIIRWRLLRKRMDTGSLQGTRGGALQV